MRLIDADALIADCNIYNSWVVKAWTDDQPTVDAEPVRHGHWIPWLDAKDEFGRRFTAIYMCSECKTATHCYQSDYCPDCGSKMDEEDNT